MLCQAAERDQGILDDEVAQLLRSVLRDVGDHRSSRSTFRRLPEKLVRLESLPAKRYEERIRSDRARIGGNRSELPAFPPRRLPAQYPRHFRFRPAISGHSCTPFSARISRTTTRSSNGSGSVPQI